MTTVSGRAPAGRAPEILAIGANPIVHGLAIYFATMPLLAIAADRAVFVAVATALVYALASPALIARRPRFWLHAPLSCAVGFALLVGLPPTAEAMSGRRFGEDWILMLGPVFLYPVLLVVALVVHLLWRRRATLDVAQQ
jgi:hypothetical protein